MTNSLRTHACTSTRCRTTVSRTAIAPRLSGGVCKRGVYPGCQVTPLRHGDATIVLSPPAESLSHRQCCRLSLSRDPTRSYRIAPAHETRNNFLQSLEELSPHFLSIVFFLINKILINLMIIMREGSGPLR